MSKREISLPVGSIHGLKSLLTRPDMVTETPDLYRMGVIHDDVLPDDYGSAPKPPLLKGQAPTDVARYEDEVAPYEKAFKEWADQIRTFSVTVNQFNTTKKVVDAGREKKLLIPGKYTNALLKTFELYTDEN